MNNEEYYNNYWNKNIDAEALFLPPQWTDDNLEWHFNFFQKYIGENVLDVGAGDGTFINFICNKTNNIKAYASELSEVAIRNGKSKYGNKISFNVESADKMGYANSTFNTVFAIEVVEHILDIDNSLNEIRRVLKSGGYFCITTTDFNILKKIIIATFFWDKFFYPNNPHIRFFTKKTLISICKKHEFEFVDYKWNKSYFKFMPKGQLIVFKKK